MKKPEYEPEKSTIASARTEPKLGRNTPHSAMHTSKKQQRDQKESFAQRALHVQTWQRNLAAFLQAELTLIQSRRDEKTFHLHTLKAIADTCIFSAICLKRASLSSSTTRTTMSLDMQEMINSRSLPHYFSATCIVSEFPAQDAFFISPRIQTMVS